MTSRKPKDALALVDFAIKRSKQKRAPTLEERSRRLAVRIPGSHRYAILRALRAAALAERRACAEECHVEADERRQHAEAGGIAQACAERIKRRAKPT